MAQREEIIFNLKMTSAEAEKSLEKVKKNISDTNKEVKDSINNFGIFGVTVGDVKNKFGELVDTYPVGNYDVKPAAMTSA